MTNLLLRDALKVERERNERLASRLLSVTEGATVIVAMLIGSVILNALLLINL